MSNKIKLLILSFAVLFLSCDKIKSPFVENIVLDTTINVVRKILLEDYTGHTCPNCPTASAIIDSIKSVYPNNLIMMTIHAGYFAEPAAPPYTMDLRCSTGNELDDFFGISDVGNPNGMVNRVFFNNSRIINPNDWFSAFVMEQTANTPLIKINIQNNYYTDTRLLQTTISSQFITNINGTYKLAVYILEDSIIAPQRNNNPNIGSVPVINNYIHRNVLRGDFNGTFGDTLANGDIQSNYLVTKTYSKIINQQWNENQCYVLAYIYDASNYYILQTEIKKIKNTN